MNEPEIFKTLVIDDATYETRWTGKFARRKSYVVPNAKMLVAYIPGVIQGIYVRVGQRVRRGDALLVLEAMKMKNDIAAPCDGVVKAIPVAVGQMVPKGTTIIELE
jgi:biotin carboxyl carrier protein